MSTVCPHCGRKLEDIKEATWGGWSINAVDCVLLPVNILFTESETKLVIRLLDAKGHIVQKWGLYDALYGERPDADQPKVGTVDVFIANIRSKLKAKGNINLLENSYAIGYRALPFLKKARQ